MRPQIPLIPFIVAACLVAVGLLAFTTGRNALHNYQLRQDEQAVRSDLRALETEEQQLSAIREYLESVEYVEEVARRVLGLVRPGETLVIVSGAEQQPAPEPASDGTPGLAWWKSLFNIVDATPTPTSALAP